MTDTPQQLPDGTKLKLIATDLDGTLLNQKGQVSERTKTVIGKILERNPDLHFVIATGRTRPATMKVRESLNIIDKPNTESLLSNGCVVYDYNGEILWQSNLPKEFVVKFEELLKPYPKCVYFYAAGDDMITFDEKFARMARERVGERAISEKKEKFVEDIKSGKREVNKLSIFCYKLPEIDIIKKELQKLKEEYNLEFSQSTSFFMEFMPPNTNKGTGLTRLIESLNINKDEVIAFGDGGNDHELLQCAGWPVAMSNACESLKPFAKLTTKTNEEDGVADLLERIFLKDELLN